MILKENKNEFYSSPASISTESHLTRSELEYLNLSNRFKVLSKDFTKQFSHIYAERLNSLRPRILKVAKKQWGNVPVRTLADLAGAESSLSILIGTLYKHQPLKPSVLKELSEEHQLVPQPPATHYTSPEDMLILEDETQRVRLMGDLPIKELVTGIVIAVKGNENEDGRFVVDGFCFAGVNGIPSTLSILADDSYVALVSGLNLSNNSDMLSLHLLGDWLSGIGGGHHDQQFSSKIVRVILAGGLINEPKESSEMEAKLKEAVKLLDLFCLRLANTINIDIMPGDTDPSNHCLPQQPLHPCILPQTSCLRSCSLTTNPHECNVGGRRLLGHAGQPIADLLRVTDDIQPIKLLQSSLEWGHITPTAPDTLACYPYYETDPFIIEDQPDLFYSGNQPSYQTSLVNNQFDKQRPCRLVCIPQFSKSATIVLVNLRTLDSTPLTFSHSTP